MTLRAQMDLGNFAYFNPWLPASHDTYSGHRCDAIKQYESKLANTFIKIQANKVSLHIFFSSYLFAILQLFVSLEPVAQFPWVFYQIKA